MLVALMVITIVSGGVLGFIYGLTKPAIDKVTIGEADEYYNDLGLAYNTDYKDLSKEQNDGKTEKKNKENNLEDNLFDLIESMYDKED